MTKNILDTLALNSVQKAAVAYTDGPELVFAGAGTGKTRVLTAKIAHLIDIGHRPYQIFAATFTNKAAREMRERVEKFISTPTTGMWIGTFHSLCTKILRREAQHAGYESAFTIYDTSDQLTVIKKIMAEHNIDDRAMPPKSLLAAISEQKSQCVTPAQFENNAAAFREKEFAKLYSAYQQSLKNQNAMDFDDLLANTVYLLRGNEELLDKYQRMFTYILVDEYQDTNRAQFLLVSLLARAHGKIFAVGDDDQSIYGWRGARIENILSFEKEFPNTQIFKLEENYRSTTAILSFANAVIKPNVNRAAKELWTSRAVGTPVKITRFRDDRQEAEYVAAECEKLRGAGEARHAAVLFRTNSQSRAFEEAFRKKKIPYVLVGGISFYERAEIKDCLAYLRVLVNHKDEVSFERIMNVPARGLGDKTRDALEGLARQHNLSMYEVVSSGLAENMLGTKAVKAGFTQLRETFEAAQLAIDAGMPPSNVLEEILSESGYMDMLSQRAYANEEEAARVENVNELLNAITAWQQENEGGTISGFLEEITLASDIDSWDDDKGAISFMTLHSAKGLEFKTVFLVGVEEGILPSRFNYTDEAKIEEERRLFYVGCTRAMDRLECMYADDRFRFGNVMNSSPSRFLVDIPKELYTFSRFSHSVRSMQFEFDDDVDAATAKKIIADKFANVKSSSMTSSMTQATPRPRPQTQNQYKKSPTYDEFSQEAEPQYRVGQTVTHKTYGKGKIMNISGFGPDTKLTVLFVGGERKQLMAKFAKLT